MRYGTFTLIFLVVFPALGLTRTLYVPGDYGTVQEAINAALDGDSVLVAPGVYAEKIDFQGKDVAVLSTDGPAVTFLDGSMSGTVVTFQNGEGPGARLEGFTVRNGKSTAAGGGILCKGSSPTLAGNVITSCSTSSTGGGIGCTEGAAPTLIGNTIHDNLALSGGGLYCGDSSVTLFNNIIASNTVNGGTVFCFGGGIRFHSSTALVVNDTIILNSATGKGLGGAIDIWNSSVDIVNTILWGNEAPTGPAMSISGLSANPAVVSISYSDLEGGQASIYMGSGSSLDWGSGMIDADPLFVDGPASDFHLLYTSPCRDTGDSLVPGLPDTDFEGDPRIESGIVDMGADEFSEHLYWTGNPEPGDAVDVKVLGMPFKRAILFVGQDILDPPKFTRHGYWYLKLPVTPMIMGKITFQGIIKIHGRIPPDYPAPCSLPMQGAIRIKLTNLSVLQITP